MPSAMQNLSSSTVSEPWLQVACVCTCTHTQFHGELCFAIPEGICCFSYTHQDLCHVLGKKGKNKTILNSFGYLLGDRSVSSKLLSMHQRSFYLWKTEAGAELQQLVLNQSLWAEGSEFRRIHLASLLKCNHRMASRSRPWQCLTTPFSSPWGPFPLCSLLQLPSKNRWT